MRVQIGNIYEGHVRVLVAHSYHYNFELTPLVRPRKSTTVT